MGIQFSFALCFDQTMPSSFVSLVLYEDIDQVLPNKLYEPVHYKIGVTCVYNGHMFYTLL